MRITTDEGMQMFLHIKRKGSSMTKKKTARLIAVAKNIKNQIIRKWW